MLVWKNNISVPSEWVFCQSKTCKFGPLVLSCIMQIFRGNSENSGPKYWKKAKIANKRRKKKRKKKKSREVQVLSFLFVFVKLYPQFTAMLMSRLQQQWQDLITFSTFSKHWELLNAELVWKFNFFFFLITRSTKFLLTDSISSVYADCCMYVMCNMKNTRGRMLFAKYSSFLPKFLTQQWQNENE